jgi:hypothetical protein
VLSRSKHLRILQRNFLLGLWQDAEKHNPSATPAQAGVQKSKERLDSRFRGNDSRDGNNRLFSNLLLLAAQFFEQGDQALVAARRWIPVHLKNLHLFLSQSFCKGVEPHVNDLQLSSEKLIDLFHIHLETPFIHNTLKTG